MNTCPYCSMKKPLTDKIYSDGSKFDDFSGIAIDKFGKNYILKAYIRKKYLKLLGCTIPKTENWVVFINYCPMCGRKLGD